MKITVISDSHKNYHRLKDVVSRNRDSDLFVHLGDGLTEVLDLRREEPELNFAYVKGNCDFYNCPEDKIIEVEGCKIFCTHGHNYNVHWGLHGLVRKARDSGCKIALFGHTHVYRTENADGIFVMNPGSIDSPRNRNPATYGVVDIADDGTVTMSIKKLSSTEG